MYSIRVEADFAAAHFLSHYNGKCENLHGHNYQVRVWIKGEQLDEGGMLVDFGIVKKALRTIIVPLDHTNLNDIAEFKDDPSAERIAGYIFKKLETTLPSFSIDPGMLWAVDVFETAANMARYER